MEIKFNLTQYLPIFILVIVSIVISAITVSFPKLLGPKNKTKNANKIISYECGLDPIGRARGIFEIRFYLLAIMFIIFDVEISFLIPWAVNLNKLSLFGFLSMMMFLFIFIIGFLYELFNRISDRL